MKRTQLLNRHLSRLVAELGHLDEITVADAGLPVPSDVLVIDLAVSPGEPQLLTVMKALSEELVIEGAITADQARGTRAEVILNEALGLFALSAGSASLAAQSIDHANFKKRIADSKAVIRTGEVTPYCNIILQSGVAF